VSSESMPWEPRWPRSIAALVCAIAALTLLWPLLTGQILFGGARSDMFIAGYAFRLFGAEQFKATGSIPQWNPYLFGGLPYIAAMHGDIFYPTAWLRWVMPVDLAITWGMAIHFVLAGWLTYGFARALKLSWTAAITAGVAYELTGIVASQMSPGHDGKLFVSALTPLAFWVLLVAIRHGRPWAYGAFALVTPLLVLGHYLMCYFLLIGLGLWTLYLAFWDNERRADANSWAAVGLAALAVVLGVGIAALQVMPFLAYVPYSPRAAGGPSTGWQWATSYAMPPAEVFSTILPQFNGVLDHYWGENPLKFHTEYIGFLPLALAPFAWGDRGRRRLVIALLTGAALFLLFAFAGHTPFYRPFFELVPMLKKIRAMGMVFFLVAFPVTLLAGIGLDRILTGQVAPRRVMYMALGFGILALLGVGGVLQVFAEGLAIPERMADVQANAAELRIGSLRLLAFVFAGGAVLWAIAAGRVKGIVAAIPLLLVLVADLWSIDHLFYTFSPRAAVLFRDDEITSYLKRVPPPFRVLNPDTYPYSVLMAYGIATPLGYHGNELEAYDRLGGKNQNWQNLETANLLDLLAVRFITLQAEQPVHGYHKVLGPINSTFGMPAVLYERDSIAPYARVTATGARIPEPQMVPTIVNPRFPVSQIALFPDTAAVQVAPLRQPLPSSHVSAAVTEWAPGSMHIALTGSDSTQSYLVLSENWYPDWHATVDGRPVATHRTDESLLGVVLPPGAKEVQLRFWSPTYQRGKMVSLISLALAIVLMVAPLLLPRRPTGA